MDKKVYLSIIAASATIAVVWQMALLLTPIAKPLAWALIIGIATLPHHERLAQKYPGRPNRAAAMMLLVVIVCIILPVSFLVVRIAQNAAEWYSTGQQLFLDLTRNGAEKLAQFPLVHNVATLAEKYGVDVSGLVAKQATNASGYILEFTTNTAKSVGELFFTLAVALFILFFIYRDIEKLVAVAIAKFATNQEKARRYCAEIRDITVAVTVGTFLTCFVQGAIAAIGYFVAGVPAPFLCGAITSIAALVPVVGTALVWVPIVALIAINGAYMKAALLTAWCLIFVGLADNAIRPLAIGAKNDIPVPAVVLGAICGVFALGVLGLILGPVLFASIYTLLQGVAKQDPSDEFGDE